MKKVLTFAICILFFAANAQKSDTAKPLNQRKMIPASLYEKSFTIEDISGNVFEMKTLKGKKVMIVNTASKCGLTPQYKELEALYKAYKDKNFVIIGFPANNFAKQEPASNKEIAEFCQLNYGVSFPMMAKISVKGDDMAPIYEFLTNKSMNGVRDSEVEWNFQKYLINEKGELVDVIDPKTSPTDKKILDWLKS